MPEAWKNSVMVAYTLGKIDVVDVSCCLNSVVTVQDISAFAMISSCVNAKVSPSYADTVIPAKR